MRGTRRGGEARWQRGEERVVMREGGIGSEEKRDREREGDRDVFV